MSSQAQKLNTKTEKPATKGAQATETGTKKGELDPKDLDKVSGGYRAL